MKIPVKFNKWLIAVLVFAIFIFAVTFLLQYLSNKYYLMDVTGNNLSVVFLRVLFVSVFWFFAFAIGGFLSFIIRSWVRYLAISICVLLFVAWLVVWLVNTDVLYFSGLYFGPLILDHADAMNGVMLNDVTYLSVGVFVVFVVLFIFSLKLIRTTKHHQSKELWMVLFALLMVLLSYLFTKYYVFQNIPDYLIFKSFYEDFNEESPKGGELSPIVQAKLERFGLDYQPDEFFVAAKDEAYEGESGGSESGGKSLLPEKFSKEKPNVLIVFFESMSARLTDVYNPKFTDLTPGMDAMANDPNTTIFRNYYNSSTPTIYALTSQLCSFLVTSNHNTITKNNKLPSRRLLCLPEIMKKEGGYSNVEYVTAITKTFAHTDTIFSAAGVDKIFDWKELSNYIDQTPLSWGYSDHQVFSFLWNYLNKKSANGPFFMMASTLDVHAPYSNPKDMIYYKDGDEKVLNTVRTSDDAFKGFWDKFSKSDLYKNTIVIVTADHAIQSGGIVEQNLREYGGGGNVPYDQVVFMMYIPDNILEKEYDIYSSGLDFTPTILNLFGIKNVKNSFEGHSIFSDRVNYPYILGMDQYGIYVNAPNDDGNGERIVNYGVPTYMNCSQNTGGNPDPFYKRLTLCEALSVYNWKNKAWLDGRYGRE